MAKGKTGRWDVKAMYWHVRNTLQPSNSGENWESEIYAMEISVVWAKQRGLRHQGQTLSVVHWWIMSNEAGGFEPRIWEITQLGIKLLHKTNHKIQLRKLQLGCFTILSSLIMLHSTAWLIRNASTIQPQSPHPPRKQKLFDKKMSPSITTLRLCQEFAAPHKREGGHNHMTEMWSSCIRTQLLPHLEETTGRSQ